MELQQLAELIKKYSPSHFDDICNTLASLSTELELTKKVLSKDLMEAQKQDSFSKAREILDAQEELSQMIIMIRKRLSEFGVETNGTYEDDIEDNDEHISDAAERPDYSLYSMDDTVAYDIEDTKVTFKRPAAFSYKGKRYPVTKWKTLLSKLCDILYMENPTVIRDMVNNTRQQGTPYIKMSTNKADIHSPIKIADSNIWIETNRSAADIRKYIIVLLERYSIPTQSVKVYFRRDYAALHGDDLQNKDKPQ